MGNNLDEYNNNKTNTYTDQSISQEIFFNLKMDAFVQKRHCEILAQAWFEFQVSPEWDDRLHFTSWWHLRRQLREQQSRNNEHPPYLSGKLAFRTIQTCFSDHHLKIDGQCTQCTQKMIT